MRITSKVLALVVCAAVGAMLAPGCDAATVARHTRRCAWSAAVFAGLMALGLAASFIANGAYRGDSPTDRASRLAMLISEVMNTTAFAVLVVLLPLIAAAVLHLRARRVRARA